HPDEQLNYTFTPQTYNGPFHSITPAFYGLTHRGWGQFLYNGGLHITYDDEDNITSQESFDGLIDLNELECNFDDFNQDDAENLEDEINETDPDSVSDGEPTP